MILIFTVAMILYSTGNSVLGQSSKNSSDGVGRRSDLLFVQLLFRHGDRTPINFYKNDPWKDREHWDNDPGQLTNLGKQQLFALGQYVRERYAGYLNPTYSENDIYVQSSDINRTISSAKAFLTGAYEANTMPDSWWEDLPWNPSLIVHATPAENDNMIRASAKCAAFPKHYDDFMESAEIKEFDRKHQDLYDYLSLHSGNDVKKMRDVIDIRDALLIEGIHNKSLPDWTKRVTRGGDLYDSIEEAFEKSYVLDTSTPFMAKIRAGFLLKDILDRFTNKTKSLLDPDRQLWVYSGHESTIMRVLNSLGISQPTPPYSTCIHFEMRNIDDVPHIEIFFKDPSASAVQLSVPNCGLSCPLADFFALYGNILPTRSFEEECELLDDRSNADKNAANYIMGIVALSVLLKQFLHYTSGAF